ncbi:MAG: 1 4-dihydroxy-2-naphthoate [Prolixibacteraceae bacterium]|nr:MAG: 1 4-dihydroxy-2-naphthoate [Prolixibacteraceae bacterium]
MNAIDFAMWGRALKTIPRISKEEWMRVDIVSKWLIASRSAVFIMTVIAGAIGGIMAWYSGSFSGVNFLAAIIGLVFAHASNNLLNDLIDSRKGIDKGNYYRSLYGPQTVEHGLLSKAGIYSYIGFSMLIAVLSGVFLIYQTGIVTLYLMLAGLFFLLFYTWPLKYIGLGEITVVLVWGPLMVGGTYYVTSGGEWSWPVAIVGIIYAMGPTSVLFGKHTDKLKEDKAKRVFTLPVILGELNSRRTTIVLWLLQYILVGWLILSGKSVFALAVVVFAIPKFIWAAKIFSKPRPETEPDTLDKGVWPLYLSAHAFIYNKRFGLLFLLGLIIDLVLVKQGVLLCCLAYSF